MATTITNLSGDFDDWTEAEGSLVISSISEATFLSENPGAAIPQEHNDSLGILKIVQSSASGVRESFSAQLASPRAFSAIKNITMRAYIPPADRAKWVDTGNNARFEVASGTTGVHPITNGFLSNFMSFKPAADNIEMMPGAWNCSFGHNFAITTNPPDTRTGWMANCAKVGTPVNLDYMLWGMVGSSLGDTTLYIFDVVEIIEDQPRVYFTADDGYDEHAEVSEHMRNATTFAGGNLARTLPCTFGIIDSLVDSGANYVTSAELRTMQGEGSTLGCHGATGWDTVTTAAMTTEITDWQARVATESWPTAFAEFVTYPENNMYGETTSSDLIIQVARDNGLKANRGGPFFGMGLTVDDILTDTDSSMNFGTGIVEFGQPSGTSSNAARVNSAASAEEVMDFMDETGLPVCMVMHQVPLSGATGNQINEPEWDAAMEEFADELVLGSSSRISTADYQADLIASGILTAPGGLALTFDLTSDLTFDLTSDLTG